jgi:nucleotide-binding universal stress UspA family protein
MPVQVPTHIAIKNILFATDFSPASESALPFAVSVARRFGSSIHAVHVLSHGELAPLPDGSPILMDTSMARAQDEMNNLVCSEAFEGVEHDGIVRNGVEVWTELAAMVESEKIDLVVLGTHGREGLKQVILGSVAETIFRFAPCPVMIVGPKVAKKPTGPMFRDVLFATDLTPQSLQSLPFVEAFAEQDAADLIVLHVTQEKVQSRKEEATTPESLRKWMRDLIPPKPHVEYEVAFGSPTENILNIADDRQCDLIMLGAHHASNFATHVPGGIAHRVVSEATCPVMTVHWNQSAPVWY